jgi:hypothetical protein
MGTALDKGQPPLEVQQISWLPADHPASAP